MFFVDRVSLLEELVNLADVLPAFTGDTRHCLKRVVRPIQGHQLIAPPNCLGLPHKAIRLDSAFIGMAVSEFNRFVLLSNVDPYTPVLWLKRFFTWLEPIANAISLPVSDWLLNSWALGQTEPIVERSLMATSFFLFIAKDG